MILDTIDNLILYAKYHLDLTDELDEIYIRNILLNELHLTHPNEIFNHKDEEKIKNLVVPDVLIDELNDYLINTLGLTNKEAELEYTKIMGILTKNPSEVNKTFKSIYQRFGDKKALDYLYNLSISNYYFQKTKVDKNIVWNTDYPSKNIEVSINLSKPEKNNKDIAKLLVKPDPSQIKYPKCLLCLENLGFAGNLNHPARENIRIIPIKLSGEEWYLQYSPYGYFYKHCIVFSKKHSNMIINEDTFIKLSDFVDMFPSFFIGSNADLPIVGGSILNHEHYQGGEHLLPVMKAKTKKEYKILTFNDVQLYKLDWYNTCLLVVSKNKNHLVKTATIILNGWRNYDDYGNDIISHSGEVCHNTITPSIRKEGDTYFLYLILRNNRCNEEFPEGIFHAHPEFHHIKKEGIGIIEAMGLFILPARLVRQENEIIDVLKKKLSNEEIAKKYPDLVDFFGMINELKVDFNEENICSKIKKYIEKVCQNILINTAVFKDNEKGNVGLDKFIGGLKL